MGVIPVLKLRHTLQFLLTLTVQPTQTHQSNTRAPLRPSQMNAQTPRHEPSVPLSPSKPHFEAKFDIYNWKHLLRDRAKTAATVGAGAANARVVTGVSAHPAPSPSMPLLVSRLSPPSRPCILPGEMGNGRKTAAFDT